MKKTILGLAFLTIASVSFGAAAQSANNNAECNKTECVKKCTKGEKAGKKGDKKKGDRKANAAEKQAARQAALFEGISLTTEQKGRIEALNGAMKVSRQELKDAAKTARQNGDTTFNMRAQAKKLRGKYIQDLGEILSSDQMVTYLENFYVNSGNQKGGKKNIAFRGERKGGKMMLDKDARKGMRKDLKDMKARGERKAESAKASL